MPEWENVFLEALRNTSFEGVTVSLHYVILSLKKKLVQLKT